jgi:tetratricopeptide (TPR) repeat protein
MDPDLPGSPESTQATEPESFYIKLPEGPRITSAEALRMEQELQERLRSLGPRAETLKPLAIFYSRVGQQETAYGLLQTWMKHAQNPEETAECLLMCGQLAEQVEQPRSAVAFYREGLELNPKHPAVGYFLHNNLAYCLNALTEYTEGMSHCRAAIGLDPSRAYAYKNLGVSLMGLGRYAEAAETWFKALHLDVSDTRPLDLLEQMLVTYREAVAAEVPDLDARLESCRRAAASAKSGRFADWARGLTYN